MSKINKVKCQMSKINKVNFDGAYLRSSSGHFLIFLHSSALAIFFTKPQASSRAQTIAINSCKNVTLKELLQCRLHYVAQNSAKHCGV